MTMACVFFCQKNKRQGRRIVLSLSPEWRVAVKALEACRKTRPENMLFRGYRYEKTHIDKY
ncbi:hypothetical protein WCP94_002419 [Bilophila wadsworthia]